MKKLKKKGRVAMLVVAKLAEILLVAVRCGIEEFSYRCFINYEAEQNYNY